MSQTSAIFEDLAQVRLPARPVHLAIGMFDGVHRGHQAVVGSAVEAARRDQGIAGGFTFWPHPSRILRPNEPVPMILERGVRRHLLQAFGLDFLVEQPFDRGFAAIEAGAFVKWLRRGMPQLASIHVGENWRFGHARKGDVALLARLAAEEGIGVQAIRRVSDGGHPISSSRIRQLLGAGEMAEAARLLGRAYEIEGTVVTGRQLGRTLGFPTLNFDWQPELPPRFGVYAVRVEPSADGSGTLPGVANWGVRPTVAGNSSPLLEVHLLADCPFTVGARLRVRFERLLRVERKFGSLEELRAQIARDREEAAKVLS